MKPNKKLSHIGQWWGRYDRTTIFSGLMLVLITLLLMRPPWDPDMGWHIRNGQDILRFGVPQGDLYSYTMFGYPWISHEWLTDVGFYLVYTHWGPIALSVIFASIVLAAYLLAAGLGRRRLEIVLMTGLISALVAMSIVGIRAQMITLLGLAATLWLLFAWRDFPPYRGRLWWLVPMMLVWVNLHGGFAIGLVLVGSFWLIELIKYWLVKWHKLMDKKVLSIQQFWQLAGVGLSMAMITLINPYTWRVYEELIRTIFDQTVKRTIGEWMPVTLGTPQSTNLIIIAVLVCSLWLINNRKADFTKLILSVLFLGLSLTSWRNISLFPLVALPLLGDLLDDLSPKGFLEVLHSVWIGLGLLALIGYFGFERYQTIVPFQTQPAMFQQMGAYPYGAVEYIKTNQPAGKLFNEYNWGGYLIWQLPERRVFMDGRMAIWKTAEQNAFQDYLTIAGGEDATPDLLKKYDVGLVLVYKNRSGKNYFLQNNENWRIIYNDATAFLFQRVDLMATI